MKGSLEEENREQLPSVPSFPSEPTCATDITRIWSYQYTVCTHLVHSAGRPLPAGLTVGLHHVADIFSCCQELSKAY